MTSYRSHKGLALASRARAALGKEEPPRVLRGKCRDHVAGQLAFTHCTNDLRVWVYCCTWHGGGCYIKALYCILTDRSVCLVERHFSSSVRQRRPMMFVEVVGTEA